MPGFNSHTSLVNRTTKLLDAIAANADLVPPAEALRGQLDQAVAQLRDLITRRDTFKAEKQILSRQLIEVARRVNDLGIDLRVVLKAALGTRSEKLTEFDMAPRRQVVRADRSKAKAAAAAKRKAAQAQPVSPAPDPDPEA